MRRLVDGGAVAAGWVGAGMAVVLVIAFELVIPVQPLVFMLAPVLGLAIGWYANVRAERRRPRWRVLTNAAWAGAVTALALALLYAGVRLVFVYADSGYPDFNRLDPATRQPIPPYCASGPDCTYNRHLAAGRGAQLDAVGVRDADSFSRFFLAEQATGGLLLVGLTVGGALLAGAGLTLAGGQGVKTAPRGLGE